MNPKIENRKIQIKYKNEENVEFHIANLALIGEITTPNGMVDEDWLIGFVTWDGNLMTVPVWTTKDEFLKNLADLLGLKITFSLSTFTEWKSRIIYPQALAEYPFISKPSGSLWDAICSIFDPERRKIKLSNEARSYLESRQIR